MTVSRRSFIKGTASGAAGTALAGGVLIGGARADAKPDQGSDASTVPAYPFHGAHQAGVLTPDPGHKQPFACVAAFDCTAANKAELGILMYELTERAWFLTTGGTPPDLGVGQPPADSDVLGPTVPADGLTITLSVGSSLFDDRYGLGRQKPLRLSPMPPFPNDFLDPAWLGGDLLLQFCANHPDVIHHAIRDILKADPWQYAAALENGGLRLAAAPVRYPAQPARLQGRHRQPDRTLAGSLVWVDDPESRAGRRAARTRSCG